MKIIVKKYLRTSLVIFGCVTRAIAQTDSLDFDNVPEKQFVQSAFYGATVVNTSSTNVCDPGTLNLIIGHRFGRLNQGAYNFYGLDEAVMRLGFEYGVSSKFTVGIGRLSLGKNYDGYVKYRLITQSKNGLSNNLPVSVSLFASSAFSSEKLKALNRTIANNQFISTLTYAYQLHISREFSPALSLQLSPTYLHKNQTEMEGQLHDIYAIGSAARIKLSKRLQLNVDYSYVANKERISTIKIYNPVGLGLDIVTGGHVFKLHFTNSPGIIEKEYLLNTVDNFWKGNIRFGFTVLRSFVLKPAVKGGYIH